MVPSQIIAAIDNMFGPNRNELDRYKITFAFKDQVRTLLALLELLPNDLVKVPFVEFNEFLQCRSALISAVKLWDVSSDSPVKNISSGRDPVERIRQLLSVCPDENPPLAPDLIHIGDDLARANVQEHIRAAWIDFNAQEWNGATVFAASAIEAILYWAIKNHPQFHQSSQPLDKQHLSDYIKEAKKLSIIDDNTVKQLSLANEARNWIHAGKVARTGAICSKATALTALAGLEVLLNDPQFQQVLSTPAPKAP